MPLLPLLGQDSGPQGVHSGISPQELTRRRKLAEALLAGGMGDEPITHPMQGVARMAQALMGGLVDMKAARQEREGRASGNQALLSALFGGGGGAGATSSSAQIPPTSSTDPVNARVDQAFDVAEGGGGSNYRDAIASIESRGSGDYAAIGPKTKSGDRAYGRYQVMGNNVGPWTQAALGKKLTPEEFLASPEAQDAVFDHRFGGYVNAYGPEGAAQAWFGGPGSVGKAGRQDQLGTSVGEYGNRFMAALGPQAGTDPMAYAQAGPMQAPADPFAMLQAGPMPVNDRINQAFDVTDPVGARINQAFDVAGGNTLPMPADPMAYASPGGGFPPQGGPPAAMAQAGGMTQPPAAQPAVDPIMALLPRAREVGFGGLDAPPDDPRKAIAAALLGNEWVDPQMAQFAMGQLFPDPPDPFTLGSNEVRFSGEGEEIARGPEKQENLPSAVQEYQFAVSQGFPGTFQDWEASKKGGMSLQVDPTTGAVTFQQGQNIKPLTEAQSKDTVYATRAEGALPIIDQHGEALTSLGETVAGGVPLAGNYMKSPEFQQAEQAGREFLQAILRKDTGAAITSQEQELYGTVYLPQPGDSPEVLKQKQTSRRRALEAIKAGMPAQAILNQEKALHETEAAEPEGEPVGIDRSSQSYPDGTVIENGMGERLVRRNGEWVPFDGE